MLRDGGSQKEALRPAFDRSMRARTSMSTARRRGSPTLSAFAPTRSSMRRFRLYGAGPPLRKARKRIANALGRVKQAVSHRHVLNRDIWAGRHSH